MKIVPRDYQEAAISAIVQDFSAPGNSVAVAPTGSGKSIIIAEVARRINKPLIVLQPSLEILQQNYEKLCLYFPKEEIGIYSASAGIKEVKKITLATIGSVYKSIDAITAFVNAGVEHVLQDECHLVSIDTDEGMYLDFFALTGIKKVVGLTATPFRMSKSMAFTPQGKMMLTSIKVITRIEGKRGKGNAFWKRIIFNLSTQRLIDEGYLQKPTYYDYSTIVHESIPVNKTFSDFNLEKYEEMILPSEEGILAKIVELSNISHTVLVFCVSVEQAKRFSEVTKDSAYVHSLTPKKERADIIAKFKAGEIKIVYNVSTMTTGFDHPRLDGIALIRPTRSLGLYSQMVGRIMRKHPDKTIARVIDFSGTVKSIGTAESIELYMEKGLVDIRTSKKDCLNAKVLYQMKAFKKE